MAENSNPTVSNPAQPSVAETNIKPSAQDTKPVENPVEKKLQDELSEATKGTADKSFNDQSKRIDAALEAAGVPVPKETLLNGKETTKIGDLLDKPSVLESRIGNPSTPQSSSSQEPVLAEKVE